MEGCPYGCPSALAVLWVHTVIPYGLYDQGLGINKVHIYLQSILYTVYTLYGIKYKLYTI